MRTFKQYVVDEMGGDVAAGFKSSGSGEFNTNQAEKHLRPIIFDADMLLRRKDRLSPETLVDQARDLLDRFVAGYESLGSEATPLKAKIADKYTQIKKLLHDRQHTLEDCVQALEKVVNMLHG
jgi:hypothetical protein